MNPISSNLAKQFHDIGEQIANYNNPEYGKGKITDVDRLMRKHKYAYSPLRQILSNWSAASLDAEAKKEMIALKNLLIKDPGVPDDLKERIFELSKQANLVEAGAPNTPAEEKFDYSPQQPAGKSALYPEQQRKREEASASNVENPEISQGVASLQSGKIPEITKEDLILAETIENHITKLRENKDIERTLNDVRISLKYDFDYGFGHHPIIEGLLVNLVKALKEVKAHPYLIESCQMEIDRRKDFPYEGGSGQKRLEDTIREAPQAIAEKTVDYDSLAKNMVAEIMQNSASAEDKYVDNAVSWINRLQFDKTLLSFFSRQEFRACIDAMGNIVDALKTTSGNDRAIEKYQELIKEFESELKS